MSSGALSGIRVLDLSRLLPGPYCSMMLADLGAEIVKIEEPGRGDYLREFPPKINKEAAFFLSVNRNKKSMTLNLKHERGKKVFLDLVKKADVVLEGFRPGVMDKMGIGYKVLEETNPNIVVCSISGYGQDGPYATRAGHDLNYLSIGGVTGFTGTKDGKPIILGVQIADIGGGGMLAAFCILAALIAREKMGRGQYIDVSMMDGVLPWVSLYLGKYFADGKNPRPSSEQLTGRYACYNIYKTRDDRYMSLGAVEPQFWSAFCKAVNREDLIKTQYNSALADSVIAEVENIFIQKTRQEWIEFFKEVDCLCEAVNNFEEVLSHPQVMHRNMIVEMQHSTEGKILMVNFPGKFSKTPSEIKFPPPMLGQHTNEILRELGMTQAEIDELANENIV